MKTFCAIQKYFLKFQVDYMTRELIRLFAEYNENPTNTTLDVLLIKHREVKMVSDGNKISGV